MPTPLITLIATTGRAELLRSTLRSLLECEKPGNYHKTVVIENGPQGVAEDIVAEVQGRLNVEYLYHRRANKCAALNYALEHVGDCLVFFTDDDVRIDPDTLRAYATAAEGIDRGKYFGGPFGVDYEVAPPDWLKSRLPRSARGWRLDDNAKRRSNMKFLGFNWAAFARDVRGVGGFNPNLGPGAATGTNVGDEGDMQNRLFANGVQGVYVPDAFVRHHVPESRCNTEWLLERAYRRGICGGLMCDPGDRTLMGIPRWILREFATSGLLALASNVAGSTQQRFDARFRFRKSLGRLKGWKLSRCQ